MPDIPPTPSSPFHTPAGGMPMPVVPASPYGPPGWNGGPAAVRPKNAPTAGGLLKALKRRWVIATLVGLLVASAVAVGVWTALPAGKHQVRTLIEVKPRTDVAGKPMDDFDAFRRNQLILIKTRDLATRTVGDPVVNALPTVKTADDPVRFVEKGLKAEFLSPEIMSVSLPGDDIEDLKTILNTLVMKYIEEVSGSERSDRDVEIRRLQKALDEKDQEIRSREAQIRLMSEANSTLGTESQAAVNAKVQTQIAQLEQEMFTKTKEVQDLKAQIALFQAKLKENRIEIKPGDLDQLIDMQPRVKLPLDKLREREERLTREKELATPGEDEPPTITNLKTEIATLKKEVEAARVRVRPEMADQAKNYTRQNLEHRTRDLEDKLAATEVSLQSLRGWRDQLQIGLQKNVKEAFDIAANMAQLQPDRDYRDKLRAKLSEVRSAKDQDNRMKVKEKAVGIPNENLARKTLFASAAGIVSFFGVLALIGFMEWRSRRIDGVDQVVDELGMRIIGTVPRFPNRAGLKAAEAAGNANWRFVLNESINSTRTMLLHAAKNQSMQVVMVTSATQGEGKTSLASQLATSMAAAGLRTLIIDCDLRNPSIHKLFDLTLAPGVSEVLRQEVDVSDAVQPTAVPNLWSIPAGQCSNGVITALAQGHPLETLFNRLRGQFDFIMVDSCPVLPVADALLVGQHVDGVVFSIMQDISQLPKVLVASEKLHQLNIPLVGAVVNGIPTGEMYSYGYNYVKQLPA
jgi:capsular exopolysaccharide synthesis family protein